MIFSLFLSGKMWEKFVAVVILALCSIQVIDSVRQVGKYSCTYMSDKDWLVMRFSLAKNDDPISYARALMPGGTEQGYDDTDIDNQECPILGTGVTDDEYRFSTTVGCSDPPHVNMDNCGVRINMTTGVTAYYWKVRSRRYQLFNSDEDLIHVVNCDCETADSTVVTVDIDISNVPEVPAVPRPCFASIYIYDRDTNVMASQNGAGYFVLQRGNYYSFVASMWCASAPEPNSVPFGIYLSSCYLSNTPTFTGPDVIELVDQVGCRTTGGDVELSDECAAVAPDPPTLFVSAYNCPGFQALSFQNAPQDELYLRCDSEFCWSVGDPNCQQRCPGGVPNTRKKRSAEKTVITNVDTKTVIEPFKGAVYKEDNLFEFVSVKDGPTCAKEQIYMSLFLALCGLLIIVTCFCIILFLRRRVRPDPLDKPNKPKESDSVSTISTATSTKKV